MAAEKVAELDRTVQVRHIHGNVKDAEVFSAGRGAAGGTICMSCGSVH